MAIAAVLPGALNPHRGCNRYTFFDSHSSLTALMAVAALFRGLTQGTALARHPDQGTQKTFGTVPVTRAKRCNYCSKYQSQKPLQLTVIQLIVIYT